MITLRRNRPLGASVTLIALAAFVGASAADARGPDPCPHHDAVNLAQYGAAAQDAHGHDIAQMQGYPQSANQDQHEHGPCNCVGSCDSGGAPPMIAAAPEVTIAVAPASEITPPPVHREIVPAKDEGWTPYLPQAPPLPV